MDSEQINLELRQKGYRLTQPRSQVCRLLCDTTEFLGAYDIYAVLKKQGATVGVASVYRVLELLSQLQLVEREEFGVGGEKFRLIALGSTNHTHRLVCSDCGIAEEFANCGIHSLAKSLESTSGFKIHEHWLKFFGLCPDCQHKQPQ